MQVQWAGCGPYGGLKIDLVFGVVLPRIQRVAVEPDWLFKHHIPLRFEWAQVRVGVEELLYPLLVSPALAHDESPQQELHARAEQRHVEGSDFGAALLVRWRRKHAVGIPPRRIHHFGGFAAVDVCGEFGVRNTEVAGHLILTKPVRCSRVVPHPMRGAWRRSRFRRLSHTAHKKRGGASIRQDADLQLTLQNLECELQV